MQTTLTSKGQVTIPKHIRDELQLLPGMQVEFALNAAGELVLQRPKPRQRDRFDEALGSATVKWRTDDLMKLLRSDD